MAELFLNDKELILHIWSPLLDVFLKETLINPKHDFFFAALHKSAASILPEFITFEIKTIDGDVVPESTIRKDHTAIRTKWIEKADPDKLFWDESPVSWPTPLKKPDWSRTSSISNPCTYGKLRGMTSSMVTKEMVLDFIHDEELPDANLKKPAGLESAADHLSIETYVEYFKALHATKRDALERLIMKARA
jgi:hypothetical protein